MKRTRANTLVIGLQVNDSANEVYFLVANTTTVFDGVTPNGGIQAVGHQHALLAIFSV